jgi:hypothetical protein
MNIEVSPTVFVGDWDLMTRINRRFRTGYREEE